MSINPDAFRVRPGEEIDLALRPTVVPDVYEDKDDYENLLQRRRKELHELQTLLYATDCHALLVILQGMDAAGKDGAVEHVMSGVNPSAVVVQSFKQPTHIELDHDFLWRSARHLPERGRIAIHNRSWYEEVLVVRVHPEILDNQKLPSRPGTLRELWQERYRSIRDHEAHLHRNGTTVLKFFLHISPEEQRQRLLARLDEPEKRWKFSGGDIDERASWTDYQRAYADAIAATSTEESPWYVIPGDDKKNARLLISEAIVSRLRSLDLRYPELDEAKIEEFRRRLQR